MNLAVKNPHANEANDGSSAAVDRLACTRCGSVKIARSRATGLDKVVTRVLPFKPYRCKYCYRRFWNAEPFKNGSGRMRFWFVLIFACSALVAWALLSGSTSIEGSVSSNLGTTDRLQPVDGSSISSSEQQRELIQASGFQPPRTAEQEIKQLASAGVSRAQIRDKLGAAEALADANPESDIAEPQQPVATTQDVSELSKKLAELERNVAQTRQNLDDSVKTMLQLWKRAWEQGNSERYLEFYDQNFQPSSGIPVEAWRAQRVKRVVPSKQVKLSLMDIKTELIGDGRRVKVTFAQNYRSANYNDASIKQLLLNRVANQWYILSERELKTADS